MSKEIVKTGSVAPQAFSSTQHECTHDRSAPPAPEAMMKCL
jgi:hypothetical protein